MQHAMHAAPHPCEGHRAGAGGGSGAVPALWPRQRRFGCSGVAALGGPSPRREDLLPTGAWRGPQQCAQEPDPATESTGCHGTVGGFPGGGDRPRAGHWSDFGPMRARGRAALLGRGRRRCSGSSTLPRGLREGTFLGLRPRHGRGHPGGRPKAWLPMDAAAGRRLLGLWPTQSTRGVASREERVCCSRSRCGASSCKPTAATPGWLAQREAGKEAASRGGQLHGRCATRTFC